MSLVAPHDRSNIASRSRIVKLSRFVWRVALPVKHHPTASAKCRQCLHIVAATNANAIGDMEEGVGNTKCHRKKLVVLYCLLRQNPAIVVKYCSKDLQLVGLVCHNFTLYPIPTVFVVVVVHNHGWQDPRKWIHRYKRKNVRARRTWRVWQE